MTASSQAAADVGLSILRRGGNAVDAAVATALASCVADPCNTGIGGYGGYLIALGNEGPASAVAFGLWAPPALPTGKLNLDLHTGPACSVVPNVVAGLARTLAELGTLSWSEVVAPACRLAREGVLANPTTLRAFSTHQGEAFIRECFELEQDEGQAGQKLLRFRQPRLAKTLEHLAEHGPEWFYTGPIGETAYAAWRRAGVGISLSDWVEAPTTIRLGAAPALAIGDMVAHSAPLGVSGSACLFGALVAAERVARETPLTDPDALARLASLIARLWEYRFGTPAGNDFHTMTIDEWIEAALRHVAVGNTAYPDGGHTAHLNVLDKEGAFVAATLTHGPSWFGARWALGETGILMNAGMHNLARGHTVEINGRRFAVSNMAPTIATGVRAGRVALGCPGARRIPTIIALTLARHAFAGFPLQEAVAAGRLHAETRAAVTLERGRLDDAVSTAAFARRFSQVTGEGWAEYYGPLTAIRAGADGVLEVALDDRDTPGFAAVYR